MKIYGKLFRYVPRMKYLGIVAILCTMIASFFTVGGYYYIYKFLVGVISEGDLERAKVYAIRTVLSLTIGFILYFVALTFSHILGFRLETNLRKYGIDGLTKASFRFFDMNSSGSTRKIIDDNAAQTHMIVAHLIPDNAKAMIEPFLMIALAFAVSMRVGIAIIILLAISMGLLYGMMGDQQFMKVYQKSLEDLSAETVEYVRGIPVVKIFGASMASFKNLHKAIKDYSKYAYEYSNSCRLPYVSFQWLFFGLVAILGIPLVFFMDGVGDKKIFAIEIIMLLFLSGLLFVAIMKVMWVSMYVYQANYAVDSLEKLYMEMGKDKLDFGNETKMDSFDISFENVTFGYNESPVIENFNLQLKEGRTYALVGSSGSGKSTIAKLISGFYKVDGGSLKIGGKAIESYTEDTLIQNISFVFQDSKLFKKTIYENVALGKEGATKEEVFAAMKLAGCEEIIAKFPKKENTVLGSKGIYLSGGEKQRIAIARAILKDSKILIMDEASASIDPDNEHELQKAFKNLMKGKTVIMIAHRLSSIKAVDEILVLEKGKIVERGTDRELREGNTRYKELQDMFNSANDWRVVG